jgi:hypothetical protein
MRSQLAFDLAIDLGDDPADFRLLAVHVLGFSHRLSPILSTASRPSRCRSIFIKASRASRRSAAAMRAAPGPRMTVAEWKRRYPACGSREEKDQFLDSPEARRMKLADERSP